MARSGRASFRPSSLARGIWPLIAVVGAVALLVAGSPPSHDMARPLPYQLVEKIILPIGLNDRCFVTDADHDGNSEIIVDNGLAATLNVIRGSGITVAREINYRYKGEICGLFDVTGDSCPECFVSMPTQDGILLGCYNWFSENPSQPVYLLGPYIRPFTHSDAWPDGRVSVQDCFDADWDGRRELYVSIDNFHKGPPPRCLMALDAFTGKELWHLDMGPIVSRVALVARGRTDSRIAVSTWSAGNGAVWNGTADDSAYVFCLSPRGRQVWRMETNGCLALDDVYAADLDGDGRDELIVSRRFGEADERTERTSELWSVAEIDVADGKVVKEATLGTGVPQLLVANIDQDPRPEILAVGMNGDLFILEHDLRTRAVKSDAKHIGVVGVADLDGDTRKEIVCYSQDRLMVRDDEGNVKAEANVTATGYLPAIASVGGQRYVAVQADNALRLYAVEPSRIDIFSRGLSARTVAGLVALGLGAGSLLSLSVVLVGGRLRKQRTASGLADETKEDLLVAMIAFSHGGASLKVIDRLRFHLKNWNRMLESMSPQDNPLEGLTRSFETSVIPDLRRIVFLARKAGAPQAVWKPLIAEATCAVKGMSFLDPSMAIGRQVQSESNVTKVLAQLDAVDKCLAGIRERLRRIFRAPLVALVGSVMVRRQDDLEQMGVVPDIRVIGAFEDSVFISPSTLEKIVDGLLANALAAVEGKSERHAGITIGVEGAYLRMDVSDTGCGIARENWERVFDRDFTTKAAGGFGLFYARQEIAKFGGSIRVLDSVLGDGTTFRVLLRRS